MARPTPWTHADREAVLNAHARGDAPTVIAIRMARPLRAVAGLLFRAREKGDPRASSPGLLRRQAAIRAGLARKKTPAGMGAWNQSARQGADRGQPAAETQIALQGPAAVTLAHGPLPILRAFADIRAAAPSSPTDRANGVAMLDLRRGECRWAVTGHLARSHLFCGEASAPGRPYCAAHGRLARPSAGGVK